MNAIKAFSNVQSKSVTADTAAAASHTQELHPLAKEIIPLTNAFEEETLKRLKANQLTVAQLTVLMLALARAELGSVGFWRFTEEYFLKDNCKVL